jgi:hypothetical protein
VDKPVIATLFPDFIPTEQSQTKFSFRGKIQDGYLTGPGKLKIGSRSPDISESSGTCVETNFVLGKQGSML